MSEERHILSLSGGKDTTFCRTVARSRLPMMRWLAWLSLERRAPSVWFSL